MCCRAGLQVIVVLRRISRQHVYTSFLFQEFSMSHYWSSGLQETERGELRPWQRSGSEGKREKATSLKNHPVSLGGGWGGDGVDEQGPFSCWALMVSLWSLISDPCSMNSPQLEFIAPH